MGVAGANADAVRALVMRAERRLARVGLRGVGVGQHLEVIAGEHGAAVGRAEGVNRLAGLPCACVRRRRRQVTAEAFEHRRGLCHVAHRHADIVAVGAVASHYGQPGRHQPLPG